MHDEIIDEVRATKEALAKQFGFDVRRIYEDIKQSAIQTEAEWWHHVEPPLTLPKSAFHRTRFAHR